MLFWALCSFGVIGANNLVFLTQLLNPSIAAFQLMAAVDVESMLIVAATLTQQTNDKQQVETMLNELAAYFGKPNSLLADNRYFSQSNVKVSNGFEKFPAKSVE